MKRCLLAGVLALCWLGAAVGPRAEAQFGYQQPQNNPYGAPGLSPYLNMLRPGASPAINYYGLVKPQMNTNQSIQQLQQYTFGMNNPANQTTKDDGKGLANTGHAVQFFNYGNYFPMSVAGRTGGTGGQSQPKKSLGGR
jgi:hypothetical protein